MRKVRDFDSELKVLAERQRALKTKRVQQLGELVLSTGAVALIIEQLAGVLLEAVEAKAEAKEAWRRRGADFFRQRTKGGRRTSDGHGESKTSGLFAHSTDPQERS